MVFCIIFHIEVYKMIADSCLCGKDVLSHPDIIANRDLVKKRNAVGYVPKRNCESFLFYDIIACSRGFLLQKEPATRSMFAAGVV